MHSKKGYVMNFTVKEIAKAKGLSMEDLAAKIGCTRQNLTSSLAANPTVGTLERIAGVLGVPVAELFDEGELPEGELCSPALRVKDILKERKMTGKDLAARLGIRESALSRTLNGDPKIGSLIPIADALGIELPELFASKRRDFLAVVKDGEEVKAFASRKELLGYLME